MTNEIQSTPKVGSSNDELMRLMTEPEPLCPELEAYIRPGPIGGLCIHSPFYIDLFYREGYAGLANRSFKVKREKAEEYRAQRLWNRYIFLRERPYRLDAFLEIEHELRPGERWKLLRDIWDDSENIHEFLTEWKRLWAGPRPDLRHLVMERNERQALAAMDDVIPVYRGAERKQDLAGLSWTTDRKRGIWFARRLLHRGQPWLAEGTVSKAKVMGYFTGRNESEVVAFPADVKVTRRFILEGK